MTQFALHKHFRVCLIGVICACVLAMAGIAGAPHIANALASFEKNAQDYMVANGFSQFSGGYYTGTNAAKGVDVSSHNGTVDWAQLKSEGVSFAILRCAWGDDDSSQDDSTFWTNYQGAKAQGIKVGVYIYSYATNVKTTDEQNPWSAQSEAAHVLRVLNAHNIKPTDLDYPIYWDVEDPDYQADLSKDLLTSMAKEFCSTIEAAGYNAGIYASKDWMVNHLDTTQLSDYDKWVAQWSDQDVGLTYDGFSDFENSNGVWQFTDWGYTTATTRAGDNGLTPRIDMNYSFYKPPTEVTLDLTGLNVGSTVYVDGTPVTLDANGSATLDSTDYKSVVAYEFTTSTDINAVVPKHMYVWTLTYNGMHYVATRQTCLDDLLQYAGCSIRMTGVKGIRMYTDINETLRNALIAGNYNGFTVLEYGTLVARDSKLNGAQLVFGATGASSGSAYVRDSKDVIFGHNGSCIEYTNVLTGFSLADCKQTIAMRPYIKLQYGGSTLTLYGGTVHKSIGYIAKQCANDFSAGTDAYNYIHEIIDYVDAN